MIRYVGTGARHQLPDVDIIRADAFHGRQGAVQHMVQPVVFMGALDCRHIPRIPDDADLSVVAGRIGADGTGVPGGIVAADTAEVDRLPPFPEGDGQAAHFLQRHGGNEIGQTLGGFDADAGQAVKLRRHRLDGFNLAAHLRTTRPSREPYGSWQTRGLPRPCGALR